MSHPLDPYVEYDFAKLLWKVLQYEPDVEWLMRHPDFTKLDQNVLREIDKLEFYE